MKVKTLGVYARIVGYYRPIKAWNPGKRQEMKDRNLPELAGLKPGADLGHTEVLA